MNREEYLRELRSKLVNLSTSEKDEAIRFYEEYFDEAGSEHEDEVIKELGQPSQLASQMNAESIIKREQAPNTQTRPKEGIRNIWYIIIGIFALPVALPLALVLVSVAFALTFALFAIIFAVILSAIFILVLGVILFFVGLFNLGIPANALIVIGSGMLLSGVGIAIISTIIKCTAFLIPQLFKALSKLYYRLKGGKKNEKANDLA